MIQKCITTQIIALDTYPLQSKPLIKRTGSHLKIKIGSHHLLTSIYCLVTKDKTPPSGTFTPPFWYRSSLSLIITNPPFLILVSSPNLRWLREVSCSLPVLSSRQVPARVFSEMLLCCSSLPYPVYFHKSRACRLLKFLAQN